MRVLNFKAIVIDLEIVAQITRIRWQPVLRNAAGVRHMAKGKLCYPTQTSKWRPRLRDNDVEWRRMCCQLDIRCRMIYVTYPKYTCGQVQAQLSKSIHGKYVGGDCRSGIRLYAYIFVKSRQKNFDTILQSKTHVKWRKK